jgi:preprotein translocase subunit YajC
MFVTPAYAQAAGAAGAGGMDAILLNIVPIVLMVAVFWLFLIRPQQRRAKAHAAMLAAVTRGDTIVTTGGIVGKVTRAVDNEDLEVEIAQGIKVKVVRGMISEVRSKPEPVNDNK